MGLISYTAATQMTRGSKEIITSLSWRATFTGEYSEVQAATYFYSDEGVTLEQTDGAESGSGSFSASQSNIYQEGDFSGEYSQFSTYSFSVNTNSETTVATGISFTDRYWDLEWQENIESDASVNSTTASPTFSKVQTTTVITQNFNLTTTQAFTAPTTIGTTKSTFIGTGSETTYAATTRTTRTTNTKSILSALQTTTIVTTTSNLETTLVTANNFLGYVLPPRDRATIYKLINGNLPLDYIWSVTVLKTDQSGPFDLSQIASSFNSDCTIVPKYFFKDIEVVDENHATHNEEFFTNSSTFTISSFQQTTLTNWTTKTGNTIPVGFPLESQTIASTIPTTKTISQTWEEQTRWSNDFTVEVAEFGEKNSFTIELKKGSFTYQHFISSTYITTAYRPYEITYQKEFKPKFFQETDYATEGEQGITIRGNRVEEIKIVNFNPCKIFDQISSYQNGWGLYKYPQPEIASIVTIESSISVREFVNFHPNVSVPYPKPYSWQTSNTTFSAQIVGNLYNISKFWKDGTEPKSTTETFEFKGQGSVRTAQDEREYFSNIENVVNITAYGAHAAIGSPILRFVPGNYVSINQDAVGNYELVKTTFAQSDISTIEQLARWLPDEKSYYITAGAGSFAVPYMRNPVP
jgi:hypothetical protein